MDSLEKIKLTSQTAWETEKQINANFSKIETAIEEDIPTKTSDLTNDGDGNSYQVHDGYSSFASTSDYVGYYVLVSDTYTKVTSANKDSLDITAGTTIAYEYSPFATEAYVKENGGGISEMETVGSGNAVTSGAYDSVTKKITLTKGETFQTASDNSLDTTSKTVVGAINEVNSVAKNANIAKGYANYSSIITELNSASATAFKVGQSLYVQTQEVPDLWIISIESSSIPYTYTTDAAFVTATGASGGQQVGYYKLAQLETEKVDLADYVTDTEMNQAIGDATIAIEQGVATALEDYVQKTTTIAGIDLQDNITVGELQSALSVANLTFTDDDSRWSSVDANGFYTLTITSAHTPQNVYKNGLNGLKQEVLATANYDGTYIYIITDTKFSGSVSVK